jgi:hypothetical protein
VIDVDGPAWHGFSARAPIEIAPRAADDAGLAVLYQRHHRPAQGRDPDPAQPDGGDLNYLADVDAIAPGDAIIHAAPMSHGSGFYMLPHVARGGLNVVPESGGFDPAEIFELLRGASRRDDVRRADHGQAPGRASATMPTPAGLKTIVYGGGPMYVADCKAALRASASSWRRSTARANRR